MMCFTSLILFCILTGDHLAAFSYKIRIGEREIPVCRSAFLSVHGIKRGRIRRIQQHMVTYGTSPKDQRGRHGNVPKRSSAEDIAAIKQHIKTFPARQSHYSRRDNPHRLYLSEDLSIKQMHKLFVENTGRDVSYKVYWSIFNNSFNIKFGLPQTDTCEACDKYRHSIAAAADPEEKLRLVGERDLHHRKASAFHALKRKYKARARANSGTVVISFDFMQNLPLPHCRTGTVYWSRQLWYH